MKRASDDSPQLIHIHWLAEKVISAFPDRTHGVFLFALPADHHGTNRGVCGDQFSQQGEPFLRRSGMRGQSEINQHNLRLLLREGCHGRGAIFRFHDVELFGQRPAQLRADFLIVIDDQNQWFQLVASLIGSTTVNVVPCPSFDSTSILPWCASTIILLWNIPMPIPFFLVVRNGLKRWSFKNSAVIPLPSSCTVTTASPPRRALSQRMMLPGRLASLALTKRLTKTLCICSRSRGNIGNGDKLVTTFTSVAAGNSFTISSISPLKSSGARFRCNSCRSEPIRPIKSLIL